VVRSRFFYVGRETKVDVLVVLAADGGGSDDDDDVMISEISRETTIYIVLCS
jgi:hypothetical protein